MLNGEHSHDKISRFLAQTTSNNKDVWKCVKTLIRKVETQEAVLIINDTIEEKPRSTENDLVYWYCDHCIGQNVKGINMVNFLYYSPLSDDTNVNLPCAFETIRKTEKYLDKKTNTVKCRNPLKGLEFEVSLVKQLFTNKDRNTGELFLITNDLELNYKSICTIYLKDGT